MSRCLDLPSKPLNFLLPRFTTIMAFALFLYPQVSDKALYSLRIQDNGQLVACGSDNGEATVLKICSGLSTLQKNEKSLVADVRNAETFTEQRSFF